MSVPAQRATRAPGLARVPGHEGVLRPEGVLRYARVLQHARVQRHAHVQRHSRARVVVHAVAIVAALLSACVSPTTAPDLVNEHWRYAGSQRVPSPLQLDGALRITSRTGERFEGSLDVRRTDALGQAERVIGLVNGRSTGTTLDFEATLDGAVIRHVGRVRGDSITGTWLDDGSGGAAVVTGAFTLVRVP